MTTASITREQAKALYEFCTKNNLDEWFIAKDHGAYFGATAGSNNAGNFSNSIHYIKGCNPDQDEEKEGDWYDNAHDKFGGDDFGIHLPTSWLKAFFTDESFSKKRNFSIRVNKSSVSLIC
ncbi:DUF3085 domain-containing protein [Shewanella sp. SG41-4]|uniref:DUF3085 domain-containing protein n=1 Tax=Shewanella sp. SG41-4 TaxID=2760976 RepID=UPI001601C541|nr:DUF3085 domain-containing protein [Shewanella sp. SG41-4]MBB1438565.1 DUF3085 domain-containing protein [Shewanella sp. SG41-4]